MFLEHSLTGFSGNFSTLYNQLYPTSFPAFSFGNDYCVSLSLCRALWRILRAKMENLENLAKMENLAEINQ